MLESKRKKIIVTSVLLVAIVFITYISIQSFWADIHYRQAKELAKNVKNWLEAATEYEKAISISPANPEYHDEAGQLYSKISLLYQDDQWFSKTVSSFQESYRLDPSNAWAHYHLAWTYWIKKMYPGAEGE